MNGIKDSLKLFPALVQKNIKLLVIAFLLIEFTQQHFMNLMLLAQNSQNDMSVLIAAVGQMLTSLSEFVFLTMFVPLRVMEHDQQVTTQEPFWHFTQRHVSALTLEGLRSLAVVLLWMLLFIIPGIIKYIRFIFVPYVVVADPEYLAGRRDALAYSTDLVKGQTGQMFILLLIFFGIEMLRNSLREQFPLMQSPLMGSVFALIFFAASLFTNILLFRIYQLKVKAHALATPTTA